LLGIPFHLELDEFAQARIIAGLTGAA
jgi:hypothetical protein